MAGSSRAGFDEKVANLWAARIIPVILIGIKGYVSWVIIQLVAGKSGGQSSLALSALLIENDSKLSSEALGFRFNSPSAPSFCYCCHSGIFDPPITRGDFLLSTPLYCGN